MSVPLVSHLDTFSYLSQSTSCQKRKPTSPLEPSWLTNMLKKRRITNGPPRFEKGESSQTPTPTPYGGIPEEDLIPQLMTQDDELADRVQSLEEFVGALGTTSRAIDWRVERLDEEEKDDSEAI